MGDSSIDVPEDGEAVKVYSNHEYVVMTYYYYRSNTSGQLVGEVSYTKYTQPMYSTIMGGVSLGLFINLVISVIFLIFATDAGIRCTCWTIKKAK